MSGIMGIYYPDRKPVESDHLSEMLNVLAHRGSDRADMWCEESIGLGHRMLCSTPPNHCSSDYPIAIALRV